MPTLFYPFDAQGMWHRLNMQCLLFGAAGLVGAFAITVHFNIPRETALYALGTPLGIFLFAQVVLPLMVRQNATDGLRLDATGLTRIRGTREEFWPWDRVSAFRLEGRYHPVRLFAGRSISFRGDRPAGRSRVAGLFNRLLLGGRNIVLGDNYLAVSEDLVAKLNAYREAATGVASRPAVQTLPAPEPFLYFTRDSLNRAKRLRLVLLFPLGAIGGGVLALGVYAFMDGSLPESLEAILDDHKRMASLWIPVLLMAVQGAAQQLWQAAPASNLVLAGAGGLHVRHGIDRKLWRWNEISNVRLTAASHDGQANSAKPAIGFEGIHDGKRPGKPLADDERGHVIVTALEDVYETPAGEIARNMRAWVDWDRALRGENVPAHAESDSAYLSTEPRRTMRFCRQMTRRIGAVRAAAMVLIWTHLLATMPMTWLLIHLMRDGAIGPTASFVALGALVASYFLVLGMIPLALSGVTNYLQVDEAGILYRRIGLKRFWPWAEIGSFELRSESPWWNRKRVSLILFTVPRDDRISAFLRWAYRIGGAQPRGVIEDVYDVPAGEIRERLDQYRRGSGRRSGAAARRSTG